VTHSTPCTAACLRHVRKAGDESTPQISESVIAAPQCRPSHLDLLPGHVGLGVRKVAMPWQWPHNAILSHLEGNISKRLRGTVFDRTGVSNECTFMTDAL
jgi:hypothetical protein